MLDATKPEQPSLMAIELFRKHLELKDQTATERAMAASLRRDAKVAALKSDAHAMRAKAKELGNKANASKKLAAKALNDFEEQACFAHKLLTQRMPPQWQFWDVVRTRAYTNLIDVVAYQLQKVHVNALATSIALRHLTEFESIGSVLIERLANIKSNAKEIPS